jgi:hypothetical protein
MKLTTHLHLMPRSKNEWIYTPLPNTSSWRGAQLKHRDSFTFTYKERTWNVYFGGVQAPAFPVFFPVTLVGKVEGKRSLGRPSSRWEDNIKLDLRETRIGGANWIRLAQDRVQWRAFVNTVMNLRVP